MENVKDAIFELNENKCWSSLNPACGEISGYSVKEKELELSLQFLKEEAVQKNKFKSDFISRMSHELRTPMNSILGFAQLLESSELSNTQREDVGQIIKSGRYLVQLINEVLDLSKIESGKISLSIEPVAVNNLIQECISLMLPLIDEANIRFDKFPPSSVEVYVKADKIRLKQVLINLISNSIKYNLKGGSIRLFHIAHEDKLRIYIVDTGLGIPNDELQEIFEPFYRLKHVAVEGSGIGLTISKQLVELMDGRIGVYSKLVQGTAFWVELHKAVDPLVNFPNEIPLLDTIAIDYGPFEKKHTLLYIEDNEANSLLIKRIFSSHSHKRLITAPNAEAGIALAMRHQPDLILLDIHLPDLDGYEALARLQSLPETCGIPVVAISANALPIDIDKALSLGFKDYVVKPIILEKFLQTIAGVLDVSRPTNQQEMES